MNTFYITQHHQFLTDHNCSDKELKSILKEKYSFNARRMSRLSLLSLLSALEFKVGKDTGVYTSSSFTSPSSMYALLLKTYQNNSSHPFGFMNCIHNAIPFYIAEALNLEGPNIFLSSEQQSHSWSQIILFALNDLAKSKVDSALVGWVHEHKKHKEPSLTEGAHFISISKNASQGSHKISWDKEGSAPVKTNATNDADYFYHEVRCLIEALSANAPCILAAPLNQSIYIQPL